MRDKSPVKHSNRMSEGSSDMDDFEHLNLSDLDEPVDLGDDDILEMVDEMDEAVAEPVVDHGPEPVAAEEAAMEESDPIPQVVLINENAEENKYACLVCNNPSTVVCPFCGLVGFCDEAHFRDGLEPHSLRCKDKGWKTVPGERHPIAARDVGQGENVIKLVASLVYPRRLQLKEKQRISYFREGMSSGRINPAAILPCVGCYKPLVYDTVELDSTNSRVVSRAKCALCTWPLHSPHCHIGHRNECQILTRYQIKWVDYQNIEKIFFFLGVLKAVLLKRDNQNSWGDIIQMPHKSGRPPSVWGDAHPEEKQRAEAEFDQNLKSLQDFIIKVCKLGDIVTADEVDRLHRIIWSNSFLSNQEGSFDSMYCNAIFPWYTGRVMKQSCMPNCDVELKWDSDTELTGTFIAIQKVQAGDTFTINFDSLSVHAEQLKGLTLMSRSLMLQNKFWSDPCTCPRCSDPTENGTMFSAVRCTRKQWYFFSPCPGFLIPKDPHDIRQESIWSCTEVTCNNEITLAAIETEIVRPAATQINTVRTTLPKDAGLIRETVLGLGQSVLHPNHYKIFTAVLAEVIPILKWILEPAITIERNPQGQMDLSINRIKCAPSYLEDVSRVLRQFDTLAPGDEHQSYKYTIQCVKHILVLMQLWDGLNFVVDTKPLRLEYLTINADLVADVSEFVKNYIDRTINKYMVFGAQSDEVTKYKRHRLTFFVYGNDLMNKIAQVGIEVGEIPVVYKELFDLICDFVYWGLK